MPVVIGLVIAIAALAVYERSKTVTSPGSGLKAASPTPPSNASQSTSGQLKDIFGAVGSGIDDLSKIKSLLGIGSGDSTTTSPTGQNTFGQDVGNQGDGTGNGWFTLKSNYFDFGSGG